MPKIISCVLAGILIAVGPAYGRTRADVLTDAAAYRSQSWTPTGDNILDVENHYAVLGTTLAPPSGEDEIDDRGFKRNKETNVWEYSPSNWPFVVGSAVPGEAYAWGIDDTTDTFQNKLEAKVWVAGSAGGEIRPEGYLGFAGIDCSRFASRLIELHPTTWTK